MKKFALLLALAVCASGFAAAQYDILTAEANSSVPGGVGAVITADRPWYQKAYSLSVNSSGELWIMSSVANYRQDLGKKLNMTAGNYGVVVNGETSIVGTGEAKQITSTITNANGSTSTSTSTAYLLGNFNAGDQLSFWLTAPSGAIGYSSVLLSEQDPFIMSVEKGGDFAGNRQFTFDFQTTQTGLGTRIGFTIVGDGRSATSGQPLPGIIAALVIGGGALGGRCLKRRKA